MDDIGVQNHRTGIKRHATQSSHQPTSSNSNGNSSGSNKKRAPYVARACDACRRRKGRCSGRQPCEFCVGRSVQCSYSLNHVHGADEAAAPNDTSSHVVARPGIPSTHDAFGSSMPRDQLEASHDLDSLKQLAAHLQHRIGTLTSSVEQQARSTTSPDKDQNGREQPDPMSHGPPVQRQTMATVQCWAMYTKIQGQFCGPTSPDYSLNVAQIRTRRASSDMAGESPGHPSIDSESFNGAVLGRGGSRAPGACEGESNDEGNDGDEGFRITDWAFESLLKFCRLLSMSQTMRLLQVYQEVNGESHPILNIDAVMKQAEAWYSWRDRGRRPARRARGEEETAAADDDQELQLLVINLALAIALCAEPVDGRDVAKALYANCRPVLNAMLAPSTCSVGHAVVVLLAGIYQFYRENPRFSWRMCGIAGNMLLELGLHSRDVPKHMTESDRGCSEVTAVICTTVVLDRQWSASTGLPTHFHESHFSHVLDNLKSSPEFPYLKAMVAFMALSDRFTSPISRIATTGQACEEGEEEEQVVESLNVQIEQWRRRAVGGYNLTRYGTWLAAPLSRIPPWAILLNLRANAAHGMLLRLYFLGDSPSPAGRRNIQPALDLVFDTVNMLSNLDASTDTYRRQFPHYHHLLTSACALLFLVITHVDQHRDVLAADIPDDFAESVSRSFRKAYKLASAYSSVIRASRKLRGRLESMGRVLERLGISVVARGGLGEPTAPGLMPSMPPRTRPYQVEAADLSRDKMGGADDHGAYLEPWGINTTQDPPETWNEPGNPVGAGEGFDGVAESCLDWSESLRSDWAMGDANNTFFTEGGM